MSGLDLEALLGAQNIHLDNDPILARGVSSQCEALVWEDPSGPLKIYRANSGRSRRYRLKLGDEVAVDVIPGNRIAVASDSRAPQLTIDHFVADQVIPRVLSQTGGLVLHAGAVCDEQSAFLLLGPSGSGKSTLAASFHHAGWRLMGDDAVVLSSGPGQPIARAVYPSLRLFPDSIEALLPRDVAAQAMAHYSSKQRVDLPVAEHFRELQVPLKAIFILAEACEERIAVRCLSAAKACMAIVENSFALDPGDAHRARLRMEGASQVVRKVPTFAIDYPRDYARLPEVRAAIISKVGDCRPSET